MAVDYRTVGSKQLGLSRASASSKVHNSSTPGPMRWVKPHKNHRVHCFHSGHRAGLTILPTCGQRRKVTRRSIYSLATSKLTPVSKIHSPASRTWRADVSVCVSFVTIFCSIAACTCPRALLSPHTQSALRKIAARTFGLPLRFHLWRRPRLRSCCGNPVRAWAFGSPGTTSKLVKTERGA